MWKAAYFCVKCHKELSLYMVMHNDGVCPLCGNCSNSTITNYIKCTYREEIVKKSPWWKFWENDEVKRIYLDNKE